MIGSVSPIGSNPALLEKASSRPLESPTKDYQDEAETRDSKLKAVWDIALGNLKTRYTPYKKAYVLLLSWHKDIDDLKTDEEVSYNKMSRLPSQLTI
jgi:hypothetical protein